MKKINLSLSLLFLSHLLFSQSILDSNRLLYSQAFQYDVPSNILSDILGHSNHLDRYSGTSSDSIISPQTFRKIILDLKSCSKDINTIPNLDSLNKIASSYKDQGYVPIAIINCDFGQLDDSFYSNTLVYDSINHLILFDSTAKNSILHKHIFTVCILGTVKTASPKFILPPELVIGNIPNSISINFGLGNGYQTLYTDSSLSVDFSTIYAEEDFQFIKADCKGIYNGTEYQCKTQLGLLDEAIPDFSSLVSELQTNNCLDMQNSDFNEARIHIRYGKDQVSTKELKNPLILVEGFDFDLNPNDDRYGDISYTSIVKGISISELTGQPIKTNLKDMEAFSNRLFYANYDLIFVDFKDGSADLFKNGNTLIKVIQWVNETKVGDEELVILGASMGGVLARYALRKMELNNCNHCCKLYGTFDSPHLGANVPLSLQYAIDFMTENNLDTEYGWLALNSVAAKQLLIDNIAPNSASYRASWQNWLNTYGQPLQPKRIAITNGNPYGGGPFTEGSLLYHQCYKTAGVELFSLMLFSGKPSQLAMWAKIPKGKSSFSKYLNSFIGKASERVLYFPANHKYYDHASGGQAGWVSDANQLIQNYLAQFSNNNCSGFRMVNGGQSTFVPTFSALDFNQEMYFPQLISLFPRTPIDKTKQSSTLHPFHSIYYHSSSNPQYQHNQTHVLVDKAKGQNIDWLFSELKSVSHKLGNTLPLSSSKRIYNYSQVGDYENAVPSLLISTNGQLHLNGDQKINYGTANDNYPLYASDHQLFRTNLCGSYIKIENGGLIELGTDQAQSANKTALFRILSGSTLEISADATIIINKGSTLIIEEGAQLIFHSGAKIIVDGPSASLHIKGKILLENNSIFRLEKKVNGLYGKLILSHTEQNDGIPFSPIGNNTQVQLIGNGMNSDATLVLKNGPITLPASLGSFQIEHSKITSESNAKLDIHSKCSLQFVHILGLDNESRGIVTHAQAIQSIQNVAFQRLVNGVEFDPFYGLNHPDLINCTFNNCEEGLAVIGGSTTLTACDFLKCEIALFAISNHSIAIEDCLFKQNTKGIFAFSELNCNLHISNTTFIENNDAIDLDQNLNAYLSCTQVLFNKNAIKMFNSSLVMSPLNPMGITITGNNSFYNNEDGIIGSGDIYLKKGNNNFIKSNTNLTPFIDLTVPQNSPCLSSATTIDAEDNYWQPKPSSASLASASTLTYDLLVESFPHPVQGQLLGSMLSKENSMCFNKSQFENNEPTPSETLGLQTPFAKSFVDVYPNPSSGFIKLLIKSNTIETISYQLYSSSGNLIVGSSFTCKAGEHEYSIQTEDLSNGTYLLVIELENKTLIKKVLIQSK